jgi:hypothetical protein
MSFCLEITRLRVQGRAVRGEDENAPMERAMTMTTAVDMAKRVGMDPKKFRKALRDEHFDWYQPGPLWRWEVELGSAKHTAMQLVLSRLSD